MSKQRILFLDYARSIGLFLVVFAHLYTTESKEALYIYAFHMPLFFLISGYLHKENNTYDLIRKLVKQLLLPFCFFLLLGYLYYPVFTFSVRQDVIIKTLNNIITGRNIAANPVLWFLLALFWVRIAGNLIIKKPWAFGLAFAFLFLLTNVLKINYLFTRTALMALPIYLFGYYGRKHIDSIEKQKWNILLFLVCLIATALISGINGKVSMMGVRYGHTPFTTLNIALFYANGIIGSMMILCLSHFIARESRIITYIAHCSMSIVGVQVIPIRIWIRHIGYQAPFAYTIPFSIFVLFLCVLFHLAVEKKTRYLVGGK